MTNVPHETLGQVSAATALRAQYSIKDSNGKVQKMRLRIENLGVHPKNRGGVYPAGLRCRSLALDVLDVGFSKEELCHQLVVVEAPPQEEVRSRGGVYISGTAYNREQSLKDELLCTCFEKPYGDVRHMLLAHNHMMLVLRAFLTGASKWDLPPKAEKNLVYQDKDGKLSVSAVAASPNGKELAEILSEGIECEVLGWKMDVEEPSAASIISQSLNKAHELALRTTEVSALSILAQEIILQKGDKDSSQMVAFLTVREKVRHQLDAAADDPDLPELFDFLIGNGVGKNSYIPDFFDFASTYVDGGKRQLRYSAFAVANHLPETVPLSKTAVIKRAYRKKPVLGFCPNPEVAWTKVTLPQLEVL